MNADIDVPALRVLATATRDAYAGTETDDNGGYTCAICRSDFHIDDECEPTNLCRSCAYNCALSCAEALLLACDEIAELRARLKEACDEWADALPYVSDYHREKWGYDAKLARLRARVAELSEPPRM